jgi:propionyl-CoA carboxylase alpha chain
MRKLLVANRGEIARRIFRTCDSLGIATVAVYSDADRGAPHVREAREAIHIGASPSRESYLRIDKILDAARRTGADAIHPGYGFLAENADFAEACEAHGLVFVGPRTDTIRAMASKIEARNIAQQAGVPVVPSEGFPLLVKAAAGGGGRGMRRVDRAQDLDEARQAASREAEAAFGDGTLLVERFIEGARHIEVQLLGDVFGNVIAIGDRECSVQRRHQKIIEESPAPNLTPELRAAVSDAAIRIGRAVNYSSAGTIEFLVGPAGEFYFLEMNTRIQVEHAVTEMTANLDLVWHQLRVAMGLAVDFQPRSYGHAVEARLYAEDPARDFLPITGRVLRWSPPSSDQRHRRVDSGIEEGCEITIHYDPMIAKIAAIAADRERAIRILHSMLASTTIHGLITNREFLMQILDHRDFAEARVSTQWKLQFETDQGGEGAARRALDAYRIARAQAERRVLPGVPAGYRNNPFLPEPHPAHVIECGKGHVRVEIDGAQYAFDVSEDASRYWVGGFSFARESRYPSSEAAASEESASSPMPGKVLRILVEPNGQVHPGDPLVILEAMKMEQTVRAHAEGIVDAVLVQPGQVVAPGETLVHIRPREAK